MGIAMVLGLVLALGLALLPGAADAKGKGKKVGHQLNVMTRNLYLGADLSPALQSTTIGGAVDAAKVIEDQVHATKFPSVRAALLAKEIKKQRPDVVGLQEGAWWRTGPYDLGAVTSGPKATQTDPLGGDFLTDLLTQLNKGGGKKGKGKKGSASAAKKKRRRRRRRRAERCGTGSRSRRPSSTSSFRLTTDQVGSGFAPANATTSA